jgi:phosphoribosyl 1,2-cyclic phosphate phosphodiesterase
MSITLRFLGTGGSFGCPVVGCGCAACLSQDPKDNRLRASVLLEWTGFRVLVDAGPDLRQQCLREGIDRIDEVWLTHVHADHTNGIDDLRVFCFGGRTIPVRGSETTLDEVKRRYPYAFRTEMDPSGTSHPLLVPIPLEGPFTVAGKTVVPVPLRHGPFPCTGFRLGPFAYLTDLSEVPPESMPLLEGVEFLVLSALREEPHPTHLDFDQAIRWSRRIGARRTWFTHFAHGTKHEDLEGRFPSGMEPAWDGSRLEFPD